jgi:hypothetical protein
MKKREIISTAVTLDELKTHLRIANNVFDVDLEGKLRAAHYAVEHHIGQVMMKSRFEESMEFTGVQMLRYPVNEVEAVTLNGTDIPYTITDEGMLVIPGVHTGTLAVRYVSGSDEVNDDINIAIMMIAADMFNNPVDRVETMPRASQMLLRPYRRYESNGR